jgi:dolichol-phosphate mannosyltransferase
MSDSPAPPDPDPAAGPAATLDLALVMPVYNEEACIELVVRRWLAVLRGESLSFRILLYDDGSRDGTAASLVRLAAEPEVEVYSGPNRGHGPTILTGYRRAADMAAWVFQCDSDDEMPPEAFREFWMRRADADALVARRVDRLQSQGRRFISAVSRRSIGMLYGRGVDDVNSPYRLLRAGILAPIARRIPDHTFAPNVILSGALIRGGARILNLPVLHEPRRTGQVSIVRWRLWKAAARAFWQTLAFRFRSDGG